MQQATPGTPLYPRVYRQLMVASLLGSIYKREDDEQAASEAVEATLTDPTRYRLYRAIAKGIGGDGHYAADLLEQHQEANPEDDRAQVALGMALMLAGDPEGRRIVDRVLALSTDIDARTAATGLLEYTRALLDRHAARG
jgi:hypothetical protein